MSIQPRKVPTQARAQATVDALVQATAQLLVRDGYEVLTTNHIAERAGVSVGSLYQYFPNKEALVVAVIEDFMQRQFALFTYEMQVAQKRLTSPRAIIHAVIAASIKAKRHEPELSQVVFTQIPAIPELRDSIVRWMTHNERMLLAVWGQHLQRIRVDPARLEMAAFIITNATQAVVYRAVLYKPEHLENDALIDELTSLCARYLLSDEDSSDSVSRWLREACTRFEPNTKAAHHWTAGSLAFQHYQRWCERGGFAPVHHHQFASDLRAQGVVHKRSNGARWALVLGDALE